MDQEALHALVVDDEQPVRELTVRALSAEGFSCDTAANGNQALDMLNSGQYDVVVSDLRMPNGHGHALVTDLLGRDRRPIIVVLTGVAEARLTKDLLARGVDYFELKPVQYDMFAAKVRGLVGRKDHALSQGQSPTGDRATDGKKTPPGDRKTPQIKNPKYKPERNSTTKPRPTSEQRDDQSGKQGKLISEKSIGRRIADFAKRRGLSGAAQKALHLVNSTGNDSEDLREAIHNDSSLRRDVLRLANTSRYRQNAERVDDLRSAIVRIGNKRVGEFAAASSARQQLTIDARRWLNLDLAWRRSLAAGATIDWLLARGAVSPAEAGLSLSARMQPFGRILMGLTYPEQYRGLLESARQTNQPLYLEESRLFPRTPCQVLAQLLERWGVSPAIAQPLRFVQEDYMDLLKLEEPLRSRAEWIKFATWIGCVAAEGWEPWDLLEFPPAITLRRLDIEHPGELIARVRADLEEAVKQGLYPDGIEKPADHSRRAAADHSRRAAADESRPVPHDIPPLAYQNLSPEPYDYLPHLASTMGLTFKRVTPKEFAKAGPGIINCIWTLPDSLSEFLCKHNVRNLRLIVTDRQNLQAFNRFGRTLALPTSFGALRAMCHRVIEMPKPNVATSLIDGPSEIAEAGG